MSLNFCKSCSSCLYKNVCFMMRNPGLLSGGFHDKVVSILSFYFLFFCKEENLLFSFFVGRTGGWFQLHTSLCFACTGGNALLQASVYFIPIRSHCCTEGIFFLFRLIVLRNANVKNRHFVWNGTNTRPSRYCSAVDLEIWVLTFLPVKLDK